jgi:hypothetical protein
VILACLFVFSISTNCFSVILACCLYFLYRCDAHEDYIPLGHVVNNGGGNFVAGANGTMDATRNSIADALMAA